MRYCVAKPECGVAMVLRRDESRRACSTTPNRPTRRMSGCAPHLEGVLWQTNLPQIVDKVVNTIRERVGEDTFEAIAFQGLSGGLIAPIVGYRLDKPVIPVRKDKNESPNDGVHVVQLVNDYHTYIIVDDLISMGKTCRRIIAACTYAAMTCRGIVCYNYDEHFVYPPLQAGASHEERMKCYGTSPESNVFWPIADGLHNDYTVPVYCCGNIKSYVH